MKCRKSLLPAEFSVKEDKQMQAIIDADLSPVSSCSALNERIIFIVEQR